MTQTSRCTAQRPSGAFCDGPSAPDAPFPICTQHLALAARFVDDLIPRTGPSMLQRAAACFDPTEAFAQVARPRPYKAVVYYVKVGQYIKIGWTGNLAQRLAAYPPYADLLATEDGDYELEAKRLLQFRATLMHGREWFRPSAALLKHINSLRDAPLTAEELAA